ncbi:MAG: hypothetical protein JSR77_09935 [Planctomycetes bacterium]|nr:hypothetical protein [Planctomycetota bacterium]
MLQFWKHVNGLACAAGILIVAAVAAGQSVSITTSTTIGPTDTSVNGVPLASADITVVSPAVLTINGRCSIRSLIINSGALVTHSRGHTYTYAPGDTVRGLHLSVADNCVINGRMNADGMGYLPGRGPAPGRYISAASQTGPGHGGNGGPFDTGGQAYGNLLAPDDFGSGGFVQGSLPLACESQPAPAGAGGGVLRLVVGGTLSLNTGVRISSNGAPGGTCGGATVGAGAGGSVWITCATVNALGSITANGGAYPAAGGRIAVMGGLLASSPTMSAYGGSTGGMGASGTVVKRLALADPVTLMINSPSAPDSETPILDPTVDVLQVAGGRAKLMGPAWLRSVSIVGPGVLTTPPLVPLELYISDRLEVTNSGKISATGKGYPSDVGPGAGTGALAGSTAPSGGGGGGGASSGGNGSAGGVGGLGTADDRYRPGNFGSGGGAARASGSGTAFTPGGAGGGVIHIDVAHGLQLSGTIEADGEPGFSAQGSADGCLTCGSSNRGSGGGGGGSIFVRAGSFIEAGGGAFISAQGGSSNGSTCVPAQRTGAGCGGGGGGGRIAVYDGGVAGSYVRAAGGGARSAATGGGGGVIFAGSGRIAISQQPESGSVYQGGQLLLTVTADSVCTGIVGYQWRKNGRALVDAGSVAGATTRSLRISPVICDDAGEYDVIIRDACGEFASETAGITVLSVADFNHDGGVDGTDIEAFFLAWQDSDLAADVNMDGGVDGADVQTFFESWQSGGC